MRTIQHEELQQVTEVDFESDEDEALIDSSRLGNSSPKKPEKNSGPLESYSKLRTLLTINYCFDFCSFSTVSRHR